jgi:hypothetical protein
MILAKNLPIYLRAPSLNLWSAKDSILSVYFEFSPIKHFLIEIASSSFGREYPGRESF